MVLIDPGHQYRLINRRFAEMFGIDRSAVLGRTFEELASEVDRVFADAAAFTRAVVGSVQDTERVFSVGVTQRAPVRRELQMVSTPVHGAGDEYLGRLYTFRDVTNEREVDRLKTEFVSLVSHELRTPLTSIKGFVDLLFEFDVDRLSAEQREFLTIVQSNVDRLVTIINDLLDISRIESGRLELQWSEFDLGQTIAEVARSFQPQLDAKNQRLDLDLPSSLPYVLADRERVIQILTNLVSNAHKYTPAGGSITISARADERFFTVEVADTGMGLSAEDLGKLFTKFFRASNRATQEVRGTGLGLAITRSLVEAHGGQITATSQLGEGSTFRFTLLVAAGEQRTAAPSLPWSQRRGGRRVLVVEDEADIADLFRRYLERAGYEVLVAGNGEDAMVLVIEEQPDLVTLDVALPDMDGYAVMERLRETLGPSEMPPVVFLSMLPDDGRAARLGAVGHLTKPFGEAALLDAVRRGLDERPAEAADGFFVSAPAGGRSDR
jgi:PAS domain S-box-containing protein